MELENVLNQRLMTLANDFIEFQKDLQTCYENLAMAETDMQRKEILSFLVKIQMEIAKVKEEMYKVEKQIDLVIAAENEDFKVDYTEEFSEKEAQLLQEAFNTSFKEHNNDLNGPSR